MANDHETKLGRQQLARDAAQIGGVSSSSVGGVSHLPRKSASRFRVASKSRSKDREPLSPSEKFREYCRKFIAFLFSHIGVCVIVVAYMIGGAFLFQRLEGDAKDALESDVQQFIARTVDSMWQITVEMNVFNQTQWSSRIINDTQIFAHHLMKAINSGYDDKPRKEKWEFPGAFLFCLTVITTIGYGHIAPITTEGRAATIVYAIFGIPLMLLYLANIGGTLAKSFRYLYGRFQACYDLKKTSVRSSRSRTRRAANSRSLSRRPYRITRSLPSTPPSKSQKSSGPVRETDEFRFSKSMTEPSIRTDYVVRVKGDIPIDERCRNLPRTGTSSAFDKVHVPISLCLLILIGYVSIGGILFSNWESWEVHDGIYFCFITLSTIGFGDMVPGEKSLKSKNMILCALYILIGLALIAMCFNLMQEGVIHKVKTLGKAIGIIKSREVDSEEEDEDDISDEFIFGNKKS